MRRKILVVDHEPEVSQQLGFNLQAAGFQVIVVGDASAAANKAKVENPSLLILNSRFPEIPGFEACRKLKGAESTSHIPLLILSAHATQSDRILGLELGADDYLATPFNPLELILRIKKSLQRHTDKLSYSPAKQKIVIADLALDPVQYEVTLHGKAVHLTPIEFKLLALLMENQGCALDREVLFKSIWEQYNATDSRTIDAHIKRLRQKLGYVGASIETLVGYGYRFDENRVQKLKKPADETRTNKINRHLRPPVGRLETKIVRYKSRKPLPSLLQVANAA